jgi:hypothetical protein
MMVIGDYRSSNYTVSSDDEVFNVSCMSVSILFLVSTNQEVFPAPGPQPWAQRTRLQQSDSETEEKGFEPKVNNEHGGFVSRKLDSNALKHDNIG